MKNRTQRIYDWIKGLKTPQWLKVFLKMLQGIMISAMKELGKSAYIYLQNEIASQAKKDISNTDKLKNVITGFRVNFPLSKISSSLLNMVIEMIYQQLRNEKWVV